MYYEDIEEYLNDGRIFLCATTYTQIHELLVPIGK